jgi:hypothetical protein
MEKRRRGILLAAAIASQKVALDRLEAERLVLMDKDAAARQQIETLEQELTGLRLSSHLSPQVATHVPAPSEPSIVATPVQAAQGGRLTPRIPTLLEVSSPSMPALEPMPVVGLREPPPPKPMPTGQFQEVRSPLLIGLLMPGVYIRVLVVAINPLDQS